MKRIISFGNNTAVLERQKNSATITITPIPAYTSSPTQVALLADELNESDMVDVTQILPTCGKILFVVEKSVTAADIIDVVCCALTSVYDIDAIVANERPEAVI